jgi:hypothetical protein
MGPLWVCLGVWVMTNGLLAARLLRRKKQPGPASLLVLRQTR